MNRRGIYFALLICGCLLACNGSRSGYSKIVIRTSAPINSRLYIHTIPFLDEKRTIVDSAIIKSNKDSIVLFVPNKVERPYTIDVKDEILHISFIADAPVIRIYANYFSKKYTVSGSPATASLKKFQEDQGKAAKRGWAIKRSIDSLRALKADSHLIARLDSSLQDTVRKFYERYKGYADTVKSPAAFMMVYDQIDFGDDYKASKAFILRSVARFPNYKPLQDQEKEVLATIRIYEEEFQIGDKLPFITLPDQNGKSFSTASLNKQYYLIDFWSTWCEQCIPFKLAEKKVAGTVAADKLQIVSVAIDNQVDEWKKNIFYNKYDWKQLIDTKMWRGPAVRTLVFDSIPFNFLVAPNGKVIKKAIKPDSLQKVISDLKLR